MLSFFGNGNLQMLSFMGLHSRQKPPLIVDTALLQSWLPDVPLTTDEILRSEIIVDGASFSISEYHHISFAYSPYIILPTFASINCPSGYPRSQSRESGIWWEKSHEECQANETYVLVTT